MKIKKIISCVISAVLFTLYTSAGAHVVADNSGIVKTDFDVYVEIFGIAPEPYEWYATDYIFWADVSDGHTYGKGYIPVLWVGSGDSLRAYATEKLRLPVEPSYLGLSNTIPATEGIYLDSRYTIRVEFGENYFLSPEAGSRNFTGFNIDYDMKAGYEVGDVVVDIHVDDNYMLWVGDNIPESHTKGYISQLESQISRLSELNYKLTNQIKALGGEISEPTVGDIDGDGDISVEDAQLLLQYYTESKVAQLTDKPIQDWYTEKYGSK